MSEIDEIRRLQEEQNAKPIEQQRREAIGAALGPIFDGLKGGRVLPSEVIASLKAKLAEMELHDDLPNSFDLGYMTAWREINEWLTEEPWL